MANEFTNLVDLAARANCDEVVGLIEEVTNVAPELNMLPVRTVRGRTYNVGRRINVPRGGFRDLNEGRETEKSTFVRDIKTLSIFDLQMEVDEAAVSADDGSLGDLLATEATGAAQGAALTLGTQLYYGQSADAKGYIGLHAQQAGQESASSETSGTTSAFFVYPGVQGVHWVVGEEGVFGWSGWSKQKVIRDNKSLMAHVGNFFAFIGLNVGSAESVFRIKGIKPDNSARYLTDVLGAKLIAKIPVARRTGGFWVMNRNAALTLQLSRSAVGQVAAGTNGAPAFSGMPTDLMGFPIVISDMITNTENSTTI
jgi:hypothetical protein